MYADETKSTLYITHARCEEVYNIISTSICFWEQIKIKLNWPQDPRVYASPNTPSSMWSLRDLETSRSQSWTTRQRAREKGSGFSFPRERELVLSGIFGNTLALDAHTPTFNLCSSNPEKPYATSFHYGGKGWEIRIGWIRRLEMERKKRGLGFVF